MNPAKSSCKQLYPRLKAKAFETKVTLAAAKFVWQCESSPHDDQKHHWIQLCLDASCRMEDILKEHQHFYALPEPASQELVECLTNYETILVALESEYWKQKGLKLFQSGTFKGHWLLHGVAESNHCNPLHLSCYSGESFMHTCSLQATYAVLPNWKECLEFMPHIFGKICKGSVLRNVETHFHMATQMRSAVKKPVRPHLQIDFLHVSGMYFLVPDFQIFLSSFPDFLISSFS